MDKGRLWVFAANIHMGGGAVLLRQILHSQKVHKLIVDQRCYLGEIPHSVSITRVGASIRKRLLAEKSVAAQVAPEDRVLFFGNLPPVVPFGCSVTLFLQNRYLIDLGMLRFLRGWPLLRTVIECGWLRLWQHHLRRVIVQTPTMQRLAQKVMPKVEVVVAPFWQRPRGLTSVRPNHENLATAGYFYPASGDGHKNHRTLLEAWRLLAERGQKPLLELTLDSKRDAKLWQLFDQARRDGLAIRLLGELEYEDLLRHYHRAKALIFPSYGESFGLPLIEAQCLGVPILAPELDYVRDVCSPSQSFDPRSAHSIANAVARFEQWVGGPKLSLDHQNFIQQVAEA